MDIFPDYGVGIIISVLLVSILLLIAWEDMNNFVIPNKLNFILSSTGLAQASILPYIEAIDAVIGAMLGFAAFWIVGRSFLHIRGFQGLGMGDVKFAGAAGLWVGWQGLPMMTLIACLTALAAIMIHSLINGIYEANRRIPFGPFLAAGLAGSWILLVQPG